MQIFGMILPSISFNYMPVDRDGDVVSHDEHAQWSGKVLSMLMIGWLGRGCAFYLGNVYTGMKDAPDGFAET